jgi:hypothetical protein
VPNDLQHSGANTKSFQQVIVPGPCITRSRVNPGPLSRIRERSSLACSREKGNGLNSRVGTDLGDWTVRLPAIGGPTAQRIKAKNFTIHGEAVVMRPESRVAPAGVARVWCTPRWRRPAPSANV